MTKFYAISRIGLKYCGEFEDVVFDSLVDKQLTLGISDFDVQDALGPTSAEFLEGLSFEVEARFCRYIDILSVRLNEIHGENYSVKFWSRAFSLGLLRMIVNLHQRFRRFEQVFSQNELKFRLLNETHFIIPGTFESQRNIFTSTPIGREQLFSIYIKCLRPEVGYSDLEVDEQEIFKGLNFLKRIPSEKHDPDPPDVCIGIMGSYFEAPYFKELLDRSFGKVRRLRIPTYQECFKPNWEARILLAKLPNSYDRFDQYFFGCLQHLFPALLIEGFSLFRDSTVQRLTYMKKLRFLVSEAWLSHSEINLFRSIAGELFEVETLYNEHNALYYPYVANPCRLMSCFVDKYLTMGWKSKAPKFDSTASLFPFKTKTSLASYRVLYVSYAMVENISLYSPIYSTSSNSAFRHLNFVKLFFSDLPDVVLQNIHYRAYPKDYPIGLNRFDKEAFLRPYLDKMHKVSALKFKGETCKQQMSKSELVIVDSLSTAYLEALQSNIPLLCFWNSDAMRLTKEHENFFDELLEAKIVHNDPKLASEHFLRIFNSVSSWWYEPKTQRLKDSWLSRNMGEPEVLIQYLLTLAGIENHNIRSIT